MAYLIDSDVLIEAKNRYYGFDFCPGFWDWLVQQQAVGIVFSVERIALEIAAGNDSLTTWAATQGTSFFLPPDPLTLASVATVSQAATSMRLSNGQGYAQAALNQLLGSADLFLIAHAHAHGHTVVTNETGQQSSAKRYKIPDVCLAVNVLCVSPFQMLRDSGAKLII